MSPSYATCAACKFTRRKCTEECVFAPYFPPDKLQKFVSVQKVFGANNVSKLLNALNAAQRKDAVNSLVYEAEERLRNPVYGCVGLIWILQQKVKQMQREILSSRRELATYFGPQAMIQMMHQASPFMPQPYMGASSSSTVMPQPYMGASSSLTVMPQPYTGASSSSTVMPQPYTGASSSSTVFHPQHGMMPMMGIQSAPVHGSPLIIREPQQQWQEHQQHHHLHPHHQQQQFLEEQQQFLEAQQLAIAMGAPREQYDMIWAFEQQQQYQHQQVQQQQQIQQHDFFRFNSGFEASGSGSVTASGFNQTGPSQPSLALGPYDHPFQIEPEQQHHHQQLQTQLLFQPQQAQQGNQLLQHQMQQEQQMTQQRTGSDEERRNVGPSC